MLKKTYLAVVLLIVFSVCLVYSGLRNNAHDFSDDQCADCHAGTPVKGKRETLRMTASVETLCRRCHKKSEDALSHPVEMAPVSMVLPADLPLSWEGKLTCATCHDIHASPQPGFDGRWYYLRRTVIGQAFCEACHGKNAIVPEEGGSHAGSLGVAHMKFEEGTSGRIDKVSLACISCHDGNLATKTEIKTGTWRHGSALSAGYDPQGTHPIGVSYRRAVKRGGLVPLERLNPKIRLVNGKVGCTSCHDIYSKLPNMLVISNQGSRLCLECHDK